MDDKKELDKLVFPEELQYHQEHTWARILGEEVIVGISDFAQDQLGEILFIELPSVGDFFDQGEVFGQAESKKSVSALYLPISGEVVSVNEKLEDFPELVNKSPYGDGWMIRVKRKDIREIDELLSKDDYLTYLDEI